jgi:hypothetical protein
MIKSRKKMTQDEKWITKYNEVKTFIMINKRNPSRYDPMERGLYCNWLHHNRKQMNAGTLKPERVEKFKKLLAMMEQHRRKNQYE